MPPGRQGFAVQVDHRAALQSEILTCGDVRIEPDRAALCRGRSQLVRSGDVGESGNVDRDRADLAGLADLCAADAKGRGALRSLADLSALGGLQVQGAFVKAADDPFAAVKTEGGGDGGVGVVGDGDVFGIGRPALFIVCVLIVVCSGIPGGIAVKIGEFHGVPDDIRRDLGAFRGALNIVSFDVDPGPGGAVVGLGGKSRRGKPGQHQACQCQCQQFFHDVFPPFVHVLSSLFCGDGPDAAAFAHGISIGVHIGAGVKVVGAGQAGEEAVDMAVFYC